jgi:PAS domain S-box-containing protein
MRGKGLSKNQDMDAVGASGIPDKDNGQLFKLPEENAREGMYMHPNGRFLYIHEAVARFAGYFRDGIVGRDFRDFMHHGDRETAARRGIERMQGKDVPGAYGFRAIRKDGPVVWLKVRARAVEYRGRLLWREARWMSRRAGWPKNG